MELKLEKKSVIKSKSSNSATTSKASPEREKKSWSSGRFRQFTATAKKRGVYVEKKPATDSNNAVTSHNTTDAPKPVRRGRPQRKALVSNAHSIQAQDTVAIQSSESHQNKPRTQTRIRPRVPIETVDQGSQDLDAVYSNDEIPARRSSEQKPSTIVRKPRFRSRALSENFNDARLVTLQPKKTFPRSPSINSSKTMSIGVRQVTDTAERSKLHVKSEEIQNSPEYEDAMTTITTDSKNFRKAKMLRIEEPDTLVSNYSDKNKSIYNFFVDLLETTFSVYNVSEKSDFKVLPDNKLDTDKKVSLSKNNINTTSQEKVSTHKNVVRINDNKNSYIGVSNSNNLDLVKINDNNIRSHGNKNKYYVTDDGVTDKIAVYQTRPKFHNYKPPVVLNNRSNNKDYRSNLKSQSFRYAQQLKMEAAARVESRESPDRNRKNKPFKKRDLLNILKAELAKDMAHYEEPQNMYQALAIIARNKRRIRSRKIHFDESSEASSKAEKSKVAHRSECFKRRRVISSSMKDGKRGRLSDRTSFMQSIRTSKLPRQFSIAVFPQGNPDEYDLYDKELSCHSIEVTAYDYEPNQFIRRMDLENKAIVYTANSINSLKSESITSSKDYLDKSASRSPLAISSPTKSSYTSHNISEILLRDIFDLY